MSEQPKCPKCHATAGSLQLLVERLETTAVKTIRCTICGWRISRELSPPRVVNPHRDREPDKSGPTMPRMHICGVEGCSATYRTTPDDMGLCNDHRKRMRDWQKGKQTTQPPLRKLPGGGWAVVRAPEDRGATRMTR